MACAHNFLTEVNRTGTPFVLSQLIGVALAYRKTYRRAPSGRAPAKGSWLGAGGCFENNNTLH